MLPGIRASSLDLDTRAEPAGQAGGQRGADLALFAPDEESLAHTIEPKCVHGKRTVVEPEFLLTAEQLASRVCAYFHCPYEVYLSFLEEIF